jgi:hypothetical protein
MLRLIRPRALLRSFGKAVAAARYVEHLPTRDFIVHVCSLRPESPHRGLGRVARRLAGRLIDRSSEHRVRH